MQNCYICVKYLLNHLIIEKKELLKQDPMIDHELGK